MNLNQLYYFRTIAELEHYTRASEKLMVSQSSLSHAISDLEKELGVALFFRDGRNIKLTQHGETFLEYITEALDTIDEGASRVKGMTVGKQRSIAITYISSLNELIPWIISKFYSQTGNINTMFKFYQAPSSIIETGVTQGIVDVAFCDGLKGDNYVSHSIGQQETVAVVSEAHPLAQNDSIYLKQLADERFITYDYQCNIRNYIDTILAEANVVPNIYYQTTHDYTILSSVATNIGVALMSKPLLTTPPGIKVLHILDPIPDRSIQVIWKKIKGQPPILRSFRDFISSDDTLLDQFVKETRGI